MARAHAMSDGSLVSLLDEGKYFWSTLPAAAPLGKIVEYAHGRHWVEQYYKEPEGELGWG